MTVAMRPSELECQQTIIDAARTLGYRVHAERAARDRDGWRTAVQGDVGFPDLVIVGHGRLIVVELKRRPNQPTPAQIAWIEALCAARIDARIIWVPEGLDGFLGDLANRRPR